MKHRGKLSHELGISKMLKWIHSLTPVTDAVKLAYRIPQTAVHCTAINPAWIYPIASLSLALLWQAAVLNERITWQRSCKVAETSQGSTGLITVSFSEHCWVSSLDATLPRYHFVLPSTVFTEDASAQRSGKQKHLFRHFVVLFPDSPPKKSYLSFPKATAKSQRGCF